VEVAVAAVEVRVPACSDLAGRVGWEIPAVQPGELGRLEREWEPLVAVCLVELRRQLVKVRLVKVHLIG